MTLAVLLIALLLLRSPPPLTASEAKLVFLGDETKGVTLEVPEQHAARLTARVAAETGQVKNVRVRIINLVRKEGPLPPGAESALITVSPAHADTLGPGGKEFVVSVNPAPWGTYQGSLVFSSCTGIKSLILPLSVTVNRPRLEIEPKGDPAATILRETFPFIATAIKPLRFRVRDASGWDWPKRVTLDVVPLSRADVPPLIEKKDAGTIGRFAPLPLRDFPVSLSTKNLDLPPGGSMDLDLNLPSLPPGAYTTSLIVNPGPREEVRTIRVNVRHAP